jgi:hypothetical protein
VPEQRDGHPVSADVQHTEGRGCVVLGAVCVDPGAVLGEHSQTSFQLPTSPSAAAFRWKQRLVPTLPIAIVEPIPTPSSSVPVFPTPPDATTFIPTAPSGPVPPQRLQLSLSSVSTPRPNFILTFSHAFDSAGFRWEQPQLSLPGMHGGSLVARRAPLCPGRMW